MTARRRLIAFIFSWGPMMVVLQITFWPYITALKVKSLDPSISASQVGVCDRNHENDSENNRPSDRRRMEFNKFFQAVGGQHRSSSPW
ncbi:MAG: hypothetical protein MZV70_43930 [Desulfobacterales bacterium]|nr:hypothetical protein [Desulfobacterales bacterium]